MKLKTYKYKINGIKFTVGVGEVEGNTVHVEVNGTPYNVELDESQVTQGVKTPKLNPVKAPQAAPRTDSGEKVIAKAETPSNPGAVQAPLPGTLMAFKVKEGDRVNAGDTVCVIEAMKMENDIHSDRSGTVKKILCNTGDAVAVGQDLLVIE